MVAQLEVLGETGTINLTEPKITGLTSTFYSDTVGWIFAVVAIAAYAAVALLGRQRRIRQGIKAQPLGSVVLRIGLGGRRLLTRGCSSYRSRRKSLMAACVARGCSS